MAKKAKAQATKAPAKQATKTASGNTSTAQMNTSSAPSNTNTATTGAPIQPSTEPKLPESGYTTATAGAQKGETSYNVKVEKTVRGNTPETSYVSSTVSSKVSTPKTTHTETEIAISRPDITIKSSYSQTTNFYDKDKKQPQNVVF